MAKKRLKNISGIILCFKKTVSRDTRIGCVNGIRLFRLFLTMFAVGVMVQNLDDEFEKNKDYTDGYNIVYRFIMSSIKTIRSTEKLNCVYCLRSAAGDEGRNHPSYILKSKIDKKYIDHNIALDVDSSTYHIERIRRRRNV